jgi:outer membrane protein assembly factor BamB
VLVNRHARAMASLYRHGRFVIPGAYRVICLDAYNGARLWDLTISDSSRIAIDQDCGWIALADDYVYVAAQDDCHKVDVNSGEIVATYHPPTGGMDWGYVGIDGNLLFGSEQIVDASRIAGAGGDYSSVSHRPARDHVTSKKFFCRDAGDGTLQWTYSANSVIANSCICVSEDAVYFLESYNLTAVGDGNGRVQLSTFNSGDSENLVKLDKNTGDLVWREPLGLPPARKLQPADGRGHRLRLGSLRLH